MEIPVIPPLPVIAPLPTIAGLADKLKAGTALLNPAVAAATALTTTLNGINKALLSADELLSLSRITDAVKAQAEAAAKSIADLSFKLPLMKAADAMADKAKIMKGISPALNGGAGIKSLANSITGAATQMQALSTSVSASLAQVTAGGAATLSSALAAATASVDEHVAAATAAAEQAAGVMKESMAGLKSMAFAKFCAAPQPAHIRDLLNKVMPPESVPSVECMRLDESTAAATIKKRYDVSYVPSAPTSASLEAPVKPAPVTATTDTPAPTVNGKSIEAFKDEFTYFYGAKIIVRDAAKTAYETGTEAAGAYRDSQWPTYFAIKEKALAGDEAAKIQYSANKEAYVRSKAYLDGAALLDKWNVQKVEVQRLADIWTSWVMHDFTNVTPGPTW